MKILYSILILIVALYGITYIACCPEDESEEDCPPKDDDDATDDDAADDDSDDDNDNETPEEIWTDLDSELMWQVNVRKWNISWDQAIHLCDLAYGGYDDWRLPSISELRTLIRGCTDTQAGGDCGVTDSCTSEECRDSKCSGCYWGDGPSEDGCYWPSQIKPYVELENLCGFFWSSTESDGYDYYHYDYESWGVIFDGASIISMSRGSRNSVRCVR